MNKVWECKIGYTGTLPEGSDAPMRRAVEQAFYNVTGSPPKFLFSGWGATLTENELAVVEKREPRVVQSDFHAGLHEGQAQCQHRIDALNAARIAYASEFEPTPDGDPDVDNIHQNIRELKRRVKELEGR